LPYVAGLISGSSPLLWSWKEKMKCRDCIKQRKMQLDY